jgi:hypothetical protein
MRTGYVRYKMDRMNKIQKSIISVAVPVIMILVGFVLIGSSDSTTSGYGENAGIAFNPIMYFSQHGIEWGIVVFLITLFEFFWWKGPKKESKEEKNNQN